VGWSFGEPQVTERGIDLARVRQVTGFQLGQTAEAGELAIRTSSTSHPLLKGRNSPTVYGTYGELGPDFIRYHSSLRHYPGSDVGFSVTPRFFIEDTQATVLGQILDIPGEPAGLGVKEMNGWTSILSTAPLVPRHILRNVAESAGCHVYTDFPGQTYHCQNFVGFFAHETGNCPFRFPCRSRVVDVFSGKTLSESAESVEIEVRINDAIFLQYTPIA
jgi:hypothetical protein